ncbi:Phenylacetyl-ligase [Lasiodiplodia theobromae]|uniref:Phenylacetyl-ligase n=1 Tax=Lasiodiplodia theobromae TaxID=45133 RepID=UPI0015C37BCF|nr:Phenylacetyl-ligase [Lasiodiplodia theobromae]KAF4544017.1 Phenylacetyl-ligase [Lasiodiplodia theobromae]
MAYRLAPYNDSMEIGQGFESFTQEIRAREPLVAPAIPVSSGLLLDKAPSDGESEVSSTITDCKVSTPTSSQWEHVDEPTEQNQGHGYPQSHESSEPTVTYVARSVSNASDVTSLMGLTGGAAVLGYAQSATTHGRLFDFEQYFDADINYYISIRVVTDHLSPLTTFSTKKPMTHELNQRDRYGDTFISGFLEGGQLDALVSFKLHYKHNYGKVLVNPIFAVLSTYDSIPTVDGPASPSIPLTSYNQAFLHLNTLFDAYMEFHNIKQALSAQIWGIRAGTITFEPTFVRESENEHYFEATSSGLARAKRKCMSKMVDIIREVESMSMCSTQTVKEDFVETFYEKAIEFRERLPRMRSITSSKNDNTHEPLFVGSESSLLPVEKQKVRDLVAEHPNIGAHIRLSPPCGEGSRGSTFCSLDFLRPDWIVAKVVVQVSCGAIATIAIHYANGLSTVFGPRRQGGKLFELELDTAQKEKIVSCSFEMGRVVGMVNSPLRMTALRLSTNRCSILMAQAGNWKHPMKGLSKRASVSFKDLQMVDYDQPISNGHIVGFWGQTDPIEGFGLCRLAPIWCNMYARPTEPTTFEPITEDQPEGDVVTYTSEFSEQILPNILLGMKKMDTFGGANMRFNAATESVTASSFAIGVEQWSNSILYGAEFTWIGIPPSLRGVQAGNFMCHSPSTQRQISFPRPFRAPPRVLVWISGLDLRIKDGKTVSVVASSISNDTFTLGISGIGSGIKYAMVSWIAVDQDSPCLVGNFSIDIEEYGEAQGHFAFPEGKFTAPPTVLVAFSSFQVGGPAGSNPRFGTCTWGETENGFTWKVYKWNESSIRSATIHWLAIPAQ